MAGFGVPTVQFWFDFGCPYSRMSLVELRGYVDEYNIDLNVEMRSLRLDPDAPADYGKTTVENLCDHLGITEAEALAMLQSVVDTGKTVGVEFDFRRARGANTFDAHRLLKLAARHGVHLKFAEIVFTAHFERGLLISDHDVLVQLSAEAGIPGYEVRRVLAGDDFAGLVTDDEAAADSEGIERTPHFRFDDGTELSGLQTRKDWQRLLGWA